MEICLKPVELKEKGTLQNLLEKYLYEFSQWEKMDVDQNGLYGYEYLDFYWTEENRHPFFILADGKLAGFVLVNDEPEVEADTDYTMAEFFVMFKYRKMGVGRTAAFQTFERFPGKWQLKYNPQNKVSSMFWNRVVGEYTGKAYERYLGDRRGVSVNGVLPVVLVFECGEGGHA